MTDSSRLASEILQAQMDKLVYEKLGTLKNEFPVKQLGQAGDDVMFGAAVMLLDMMENSTRTFFAEMRERIMIERSKKGLRIRVVPPEDGK